MSDVNYPTTIPENWKFRAELWSRAEEDEQFKAAIRKLCSEDILFYINCWCFIYEPRIDKQYRHSSSDARIPFVTYQEFQDEYILKIKKHIEEGKDLLTEKSRDMGVSWMIIVIFVWFWQFGPSGSDFLIGSRKQEYVDKSGDMKALFPKARFIIRNQPKWLLPEGFDIKNHATFMLIKNPETGSSISGEANNEDFGSGGRFLATLLDEFSKWKHTDAGAWQSLGDATDCRLPVSSAKGKLNKFYRLRAGLEGAIKKITLLWKLHPHKDKAWYEDEKKRRSPRELAAEVDINYAASIDSRAYESYDEDLHVKEVNYDTDTPVTLMCDFNINPMSWAIAQEYGAYCCFINEMSLPTVSTARAAEKFAELYKTHKNKQVFIYGDASGHARQRAIKGLPSEYNIIAKILKKAGWDVVICVPKGNPLISESIEALEKRFCDWENGNKSFITIDPKCVALIESCEQTQRKDDGLLKDGAEHMTDGVRGWANYKYPISKQSRSYKS